MDLAKLLKSMKAADRFIYEHYTNGKSGVKNVMWPHNPPNIDMLMWANKYPGKMTIRPDGNFERIDIYESSEPGMWKIDYAMWYDEKESDLIASLQYNEDDHSITIDDLHVM